LITAFGVASTVIKRLLLLLLFPSLVTAYPLPTPDKVLVVKSEKRMYLVKKDIRYREYRISLGANPKGHKQKQGDERTPEGLYFLDYKNPNSSYYKSFHICYPNSKDRETAREKGWDPGGDIMIHGQPNGYGWMGFASQFYDWTDGCIAVSNSEMDEIWSTVKVGTPIEIRP
jgi:murein L,D-transpeptidase YafK